MLRLHLLQQWYALSDPGMEKALYEIAPLRQFARGLAKNSAQLTLFALSNLWMARRRLLPSAGQVRL